MLERLGVWCQTVRPATETGLPIPAAPGVEEQTRVVAKVDAYGSPEVKALLETWRKAVKAVMAADFKIGLRLNQQERFKDQPLKGDASFMDPLSPWIELDEQLRPAEVTAREAVSKQVAKELNPT